MIQQIGSTNTEEPLKESACLERNYESRTTINGLHHHNHHSEGLTLTPSCSKTPNLNYEEKHLLNNMPFQYNRNFPLTKSKSCCDFDKRDAVKNPSLVVTSSSNMLLSILNQMDRDYQASIKIHNIDNKKRNTWPNTLKTIEMKKRIKYLFPNNLKRSLSIFLTEGNFGLPKSTKEDEPRSKFEAFMTSNWCMCLVVPIIFVCILVVVAYFTSNYMQSFMMWIENQNVWLVLGCLTLLYIFMCFPIAIGFFLVKIATGFLYGFVYGIVIAICNSVLGVAIAHFVLKGVSKRCNCKKLLAKNKTAMAILNVINGPRSFRIVLFTRMTPLPTGIQNLIFSFCNMKWYMYLLACFVGMLPSEILTVYLGSGFRSMQDVISNKGCIWPTYVLVGLGVLLGFILMTWIVLKSKAELNSMIEERSLTNSTTV